MQIAAVNDAPVFDQAIWNMSIADTPALNSFEPRSLTIRASDPDAGSTLSYGLLVDGQPATSQTGTYGSISIVPSTGVVTFTPNNDAINALNSDTAETFDVIVSDGTLFATGSVVLNLTGTPEALSFYLTFASTSSYSYGAFSGVSLSGPAADAGLVLTYSGTTSTAVPFGPTTALPTQPGNYNVTATHPSYSGSVPKGFSIIRLCSAN
jgi:VCBS repeat-containing protein